MSEWQVRIVQVGKIGKHPNADALDITDVEGTPVIMRSGLWKPGDLGVYIPIDSIMPDTPENVEMFGKKRRIKAKKIRNIFSRGMLYPLPEGLTDPKIGQIVHLEMGITKYEPPAEELMSKGRQEPAPQHFIFPEYTDIEGLRKWKGVFESHPAAPRDVVITEKIHGSNARFCHDGQRLWVGSRTQIKAEDPKTWWWRVAANMDLTNKLSKFPFIVFYGEVFGKGVQDLNYGSDITFRVFDTLDGKNGTYHDWDYTCELATMAGLQTVTQLYRGPWGGFDAHKHLAEGNSTVGGDHVREGFVVKPATECWDPQLGRVILKLIGEGYDLR